MLAPLPLNFRGCPRRLITPLPNPTLPPFVPVVVVAVCCLLFDDVMYRLRVGWRVPSVCGVLPACRDGLSAAERLARWHGVGAPGDGVVRPAPLGATSMPHVSRVK